MTLISYCDLDPRCWSPHLERTYCLIMFYLSVKFAKIRFSCLQVHIKKSIMSDP